jgi:hypothetical protein
LQKFPSEIEGSEPSIQKAGLLFFASSWQVINAGGTIYPAALIDG